MNQIITEAIRQGAGDIYIEPQETELRVRYRIDGVCQEVMRSPKKLHRQLISRLKISSGMDIAEKRDPAGRPLRRRARRQGGRLPRRRPADRAGRDVPSSDSCAATRS